MIPIPPKLYLYGGLFLAGLFSGGYGVHTWYKAQRVEAIEEARQSERELQVLANKADQSYATYMRSHAAHAKSNEAKYRRVLNEANSELADCRVDARLISVLNDAGVPEAPADPAGSGSVAPDASAPRDSNCAVELDVCRSNYAEVCIPNEIQLRELQKFTRELIRDYNKSIED